MQVCSLLKNIFVFIIPKPLEKWKGPEQNWKGISFKDPKVRFFRELPGVNSPQI